MQNSRRAHILTIHKLREWLCDRGAAPVPLFEAAAGYTLPGYVLCNMRVTGPDGGADRRRGYRASDSKKAAMVDGLCDYRELGGVTFPHVLTSKEG